MKDEQVVAIKKYVEGAYPMMKSNDDADLVWFDLLQDEEYYGILQSVKNYIRAGNKFPPGVSEVIQGYSLIIMEFNDEVLRLMDEDGFFNDSEEADIEVAYWNKNNRKRKAAVWISKDFPKENIPNWFKEVYQNYESQIKAKYFALSNTSKARQLT
jgi:hypothetical protein